MTDKAPILSFSARVIYSVIDTSVAAVTDWGWKNKVVNSSRFSSKANSASGDKVTDSFC